MPVRYSRAFAHGNSTPMSTNIFESMHIFVNVVEHGSFSKAADALNLHRPAVTKAIQQLEVELGVRLLNRTTRKVSVTADGEEFFSRCVPLLTELGHVLDSFSVTNPLKGQLRVDIPVALAGPLIVPALPEFQDMHPDIEIVISSTDRKINLVAEGVDCVVRIGDLVDSSHISRRIGMCRMMICATPAYLAKHGTPKTLEDLDRHRAVNFFKDHRRDILEWRFDADGQEVVKRLQSGIIVDNSEVFLSCGLAGRGLMQGIYLLFKPHLETGKLVEVLPNVRSVPKPVSILYPSRPLLSPKVRVFIEWLTAIGQRHLVCEI
jgi:DNA-binding transcriptional LysR family regulator